MAEIVRKRTIRPSSRLEKSKTYKVDTRGVRRGDSLLVYIDHELKAFHRTYRFSGVDVVDRDTISFRVNESGTTIEITWSGARPTGSPDKTVPGRKLTILGGSRKMVTQPQPDLVNYKTSFAPIPDAETTVLVLGSLPGDKSLQIQEYYANNTNRFWRVISKITNNPLPSTYKAKRQLLLKTKIGVWDVAHNAIRRGSLDRAIESETPNDLETFMRTHKKLKLIAFNGQKAEALFNKYFERKNGLKYFSLSSTSSANTSLTFEQMCKAWSAIVATS